jgi:hypothetical protein
MVFSADWLLCFDIYWLMPVFLIKLSSPIFGDIFYTQNKYVLGNLDKNGFGYILGDFVTNSSGHLDYVTSVHCMGRP